MGRAIGQRWLGQERAVAGWQRAGPSARATGLGEPCLGHLFIPREESLFASQLEPGFPVA